MDLSTETKAKLDRVRGFVEAMRQQLHDFCCAGEELSKLLTSDKSIPGHAVMVMAIEDLMTTTQLGVNGVQKLRRAAAPETKDRVPLSLTVAQFIKEEEEEKPSSPSEQKFMEEVLGALPTPPPASSKDEKKEEKKHKVSTESWTMCVGCDTPLLMTEAVIHNGKDYCGACVAKKTEHDAKQKLQQQENKGLDIWGRSKSFPRPKVPPLKMREVDEGTLQECALEMTGVLDQLNQDLRQITLTTERLSNVLQQPPFSETRPKLLGLLADIDKNGARIKLSSLAIERVCMDDVQKLTAPRPANPLERELMDAALAARPPTLPLPKSEAEAPTKG